MDQPHRITLDTFRDGFTGEKQDINCWGCGAPMVSKEYLLCGKRMWTTIHDTDYCIDLARKICNGSAGRIGDAFKKKQKPRTKSKYSQAADP